MAEDNRSIHKLYEKDKIGEVQIADEVVAIIAGLAATEVEGVDSMAGNMVGKLGMKNLSKGVKVEVTEEHVSVDLSLNIRYGYNIPAVSEQVQDKVSAAIENMTGLTVLDVNIKIAGVNMVIRWFALAGGVTVLCGVLCLVLPAVRRCDLPQKREAPCREVS